jgi:hypothetical protein
MGKSLEGVAVMMVALGILCVPGIIINNLQASAVISTDQTMTCNNTMLTCTLNQGGGIGCQANAGNCNLQTNAQGQPQSISFLNVCSPFTVLGGIFTGTNNFVNFVATLFETCTVQSGMAVYGAPNQTITNPAVNNALLPPPGVTITWTGCSTIINEGGLNYYANCTNISTPIVGSTGPWTIATVTPQSTNPGTLWNGVIGNATQGSVPSPGQWVFTDSLSNYWQASCLVYGNYNGIPYSQSNSITKFTCSNFSGWSFTSITTQQTQIGSGIFAFVLTLIGLFLVLLIGLGVYVSGSGSVVGSGISAAFGSNPQGTKQAFTFGVAMLLFFPLYSEFDTWFSSNYLPYGLDTFGSPFGLGIVAIIVIAIFFMGTFIMSQGGGTPTGTKTGAV